jgi:putative transposase
MNLAVANSLRLPRYRQFRCSRTRPLRADERRWSSLWRWCQGTQREQSLRARWPVEMQSDFVERVNQADDGPELEALRRCVQRGRPYGQLQWQMEIAKRLGHESAYRPAGRPRKIGTNGTDSRE